MAWVRYFRLIGDVSSISKPSAESEADDMPAEAFARRGGISGRVVVLGGNNVLARQFHGDARFGEAGLVGSIDGVELVHHGAAAHVQIYFPAVRMPHVN